jgi:hypothetical protein
MGVIRKIRDEILKQAIGTLLWSETTESGEPLDTLYVRKHLSDSTFNELRDDVSGFLDLILDLEDEDMSARLWDILKSDTEQAGHDFILSRNGHGTGFWDRGNGDDGEELHKWAKTFGTMSLHVGDDGFLYN